MSETIELRAGGVTIGLLTTGASIRSVHAPGRDGDVDDIVLGHPNIDAYAVRARSLPDARSLWPCTAVSKRVTVTDSVSDRQSAPCKGYSARDQMQRSNHSAVACRLTSTGRTSVASSAGSRIASRVRASQTPRHPRAQRRTSSRQMATRTRYMAARVTGAGRSGACGNSQSLPQHAPHFNSRRRRTTRVTRGP